MANISSLEPALQPWAYWIFRYGQSLDGRLVITSARRSWAKQFQLYSRYLRGESKILALPPGRSKHQLGQAFDMAQVGIDPFDSRLLPWLGKWWMHYGGLWGGDRDPVHFGIH